MPRLPECPEAESGPPSMWTGSIYSPRATGGVQAAPPMLLDIHPRGRLENVHRIADVRSRSPAASGYDQSAEQSAVGIDVNPSGISASRPYLLKRLSHIGRGSSATVHKSFHAGRFEIVAEKVISCSERHRGHLARELASLRTLLACNDDRCNLTRTCHNLTQTFTT